MAKPLDLEQWERQSHFEFFRGYEQPFFGICSQVDVGNLLERTRLPDAPSFFVASLFLSLKSANETEEFRYRLRGDGVVVHDVIHGGSTILRDDETFGFAYFDYDPDLARFADQAEAVLEKARRGTGPLDEHPERDDLIHYSVIPWLAFTSFAHARKRNPTDSVPKIVFGKYHGEKGAEKMPVSVEVHHALMDGLHVSRFFDRFQTGLNAFS